MSQKLGWEQQKAGIVSGTKKKQLGEHFTTNLVNWQQIVNIIGYKMMGVLERHSFRSKDEQKFITVSE